jgi:hypothetical protein
MYVSETTLGPLRITPVTEATNARTSVAFMNARVERTWVAFSLNSNLSMFLYDSAVGALCPYFAVTSRRNGNRRFEGILA